jgi:hypothetical protein
MSVAKDLLARQGQTSPTTPPSTESSSESGAAGSGGEAGSEGPEGAQATPPENPEGTPPANSGGEGKQGAENGEENGGVAATPPDNTQTQQQEPPTTTPSGTENSAELDEAAVLAYLRKSTGRDIKSLSELNSAPAAETDEERIAREQKFRDEATAFAINNNQLTSDELSSFAVERAKQSRDIAYDLFAEEQRELDAAITDEQIQERFAEYYAEDEEEGSWKRNMMAKRMESIADNHLKSKFGKVLSVEDSYREYLAVEKEVREYRDSVTRAVDESAQSLSFQIENTVATDEAEKLISYSFTVPKESLDFVKNQMLDLGMFRMLKQGGLTDVQIQSAIKNALLTKELPNIVAEVAKSHAAKILLLKEAEFKAIPNSSNHLNGAAPADVKQPVTSKVAKGILGKTMKAK